MLLATSGVHPKIAQELMRHSNINLTMGIYTHAQASQVAAAVNNLPDFRQLRSKIEANCTHPDTPPYGQYISNLCLSPDRFGTRLAVDSSGH
jgi:hypothetical protein